MNIHNVISYVQNLDQSDKFQVVFEAHGSSYRLSLPMCFCYLDCQYTYIMSIFIGAFGVYWVIGHLCLFVDQFSLELLEIGKRYFVGELVRYVKRSILIYYD